VPSVSSYTAYTTHHKTTNQNINTSPPKKKEKKKEKKTQNTAAGAALDGITLTIREAVGQANPWSVTLHPGMRSVLFWDVLDYLTEEAVTNLLRLI
jgi:hypothetical protein